MLGHGVFFIAGDPEINPQLTFRRRLMLSFFHDNMPWYQAIKCAAAVGVGVVLVLVLVLNFVFALRLAFYPTAPGTPSICSALIIYRRHTSVGTSYVATD